MSEKFHNVLAWSEEEKQLIGIQEKFLQYFPPAGEILDLGCGRGIFLDLLAKHGFKPAGVEIDEQMLKASRDRGFEVEHTDAISFLKATKRTFDGIFASHIVEHMSAAELTELVDLIKQRLKPGGVAIVVTPRPGSLWATEYFWLDTTHVRPVPYELLKQLFAPLQTIAGGIEPDSVPVKDAGPLLRLILAVRRKLLGRELYDFVYGGGVSYIVVKNNA